MQLNWDDIYQRDAYEAPRAETQRTASHAWEEALTFVLAAVACMTVVASVDSANWVRGLPSLYIVGASALVIAYGLSRIRWNQLLLLPIGLFAGSSIVFFEVMSVLTGHSLYVRTDHLLDRMYVWWSATTQGGTSTDRVPVIVIILALTWLGTYVSSWAIFRWRNAILGLIPGAAALIWNTGFSTSQVSIAAVIYLITAVLLFMRLRVGKQERRWEREGVAYPRFISLSVLNATFWVTCAMLGAVFVLPLGNNSGAANARWDQLTSPFTSRLTPIARVFLSINPNKGAKIHSLKDALALQGAITLRDIPAVELKGDIPPDIAPFLREQSLNLYTREGWRVNGENDVPLGAGDSTFADQVTKIAPPGADPVSPARRDATITVEVAGGNSAHLFSLGQPVQSNQPSAASAGSNPFDISSLKPAEHLANGDKYTVTGSVSAASVEQLRAAGTQYPSWVTPSYLQLSRRLPDRVREKAHEIAAGAANPYDAATAIEEYLRTFPIDYNVPAAPDRRDSVDYFLFDAQRGYFDYHASAMAVMLRTIGIPARIATGFVIDPGQREGDTFRLTQQQAFAWPEVYFPGIGWVEFNPTPSEALVSRPAEPLPAHAAPVTNQLPPPNPGVAAAPSSAAATSARALPSRREWLLIALAAVAGIVILSAAAGKFVWEYAVRGLAPPAQLWEKTLRLAAFGRARPESHETPREFAERLRREVPDAGDVACIASMYERQRFGAKPLSVDDAHRLKAAWSSTRTSLLRRALRLKPRRTP